MITLYHGTDDAGAAAIRLGVSHTVGSPLTDFSLGFYTTTNEHQAKQWANTRVRRTKRRPAVVLAFHVDPEQLAAVEQLAFVRDSTAFWDLVKRCRSNASDPHQRGGKGLYDVVHGPVSLWPQTLTLGNCDQLSFHSAKAVKILGGVASQQRATGVHGDF